LRRSCSRKLEVLDIDARALDNLKVGVRTSWPPQQQGSRDMIAAAMMGEKEREIFMQRVLLRDTLALAVVRRSQLARKPKHTDLGRSDTKQCLMPQSVVQHENSQAVRQELRTY
jgi:hypothetical protein